MSDDTLAHHGIKGTKWGHREAKDSTGGSHGSSGKASAPAKKTKLSSQDILDARRRQGLRENKLGDLEYKSLTATSKKGKSAADAALNKAQNEYVNGPDFKNSAKYTTGDKVVTGLSLATIALSGIAIVGSAAYKSSR